MSRTRVLSALYQLLEERPFNPTVREVAARAGVSVGGTHQLLTQLRDLGAVDWVKGATRTLHVVNTKAVVADD